MKRVLFLVISITTLFFYSAVSEETARESIEEYCKILEEKFDDPGILKHIMQRFYMLDGKNLTSFGNQQALDWARRAVKEHAKGQGLAEDYLVLKGDKRDVCLTTFISRNDLAARVAGTNLVNYFRHPAAALGDWGGCAPSVTNTGPQALYVQEILRQYWEKMDPEETYDIPPRVFGAKGKHVSQIPAELITIIVWFGKDGEPVCNVDLEKYGLAMPVLDVPNRPKPKPKEGGAAPPQEPQPGPATAEPPPLADGTTQQPDTAAATDAPPCCRLWLYAAAALLCLCAILYFVRRKTKN